MATMYGADVSQLNDLANAFASAADRLDAARLTILQRIRLRLWAGPVAARFRSDWDTRYNGMVHAAAEELRRSAKELAQNAEEQREASLAGTSLAGTNRWLSQLPRCSETREESRSRVNPKYYDSTNFWDRLFKTGGNAPEQWANNCGYCSIAYEMRRRGYDVTAASDRNGDTYADLASAFHDPKTGQPREWTQTKTEADTVSAMNAFGPGARAMVVIQRADGGHCFIAENVGGTVRFLDPQNGREDKSVTNYFSRAEPDQVYLLRVDDQEPTMNDMVVANND